MGLNSDQQLSGLVNSLAESGVYDKDAAKALLDLLNFGDDVAQGADVDLEAFEEPQVIDTLHNVLWALAHRATIVQQERDRARTRSRETSRA
jgi:hypothetical protein